MSVVAAVLSGLLTFYRYEQRTEKHRVAAVHYKSPLKELEVLLATGNRGIDDARVSPIEEAFRDFERSAPVIPPKIDDAIEERFSDFVFIHDAEKLRNESRGLYLLVRIKSRLWGIST